MNQIQLREPGQYVIPQVMQASAIPDRATAQTVGRMTGIIRRSAYHPVVIRAAREATQGAKTQRERVEKIFAWVKANLTFCQDEASLRDLFGKQDALELLIEPPLMLSVETPQGDCDDYTMLVCAMLFACGIKCGICTVAADKSRPEQFSHVYALAFLPERLALDASHGPEPGWEAKEVYRRREWPVPAPDAPSPTLHGLVKAKRRRGIGDGDWAGEVSDTPTPFDAGGSGGSGFNWGSLINRGFDFGENIFAISNKASLTRPTTSINSPYNFSLPSTSGISGTTLLIGGAALLALVMFSGSKH